MHGREGNWPSRMKLRLLAHMIRYQLIASFNCEWRPQFNFNIFVRKQSTLPSLANKELNRLVKFLAQHEDAVTTFEELEPGHLRKYARHLTRQV